ncbi:hypothetical protein GDO78_015570 [Eleutherodactylus coqui]|uniref:Uncharacterized protein n=1 Tax=Eleutherodactylus coqui TaxID=57060 RepID=A0A8J6JSW6_ELECQ|nr:hypothetical protein GDO78_015570 [Eleutherodactylus coqui]
MNGAFIQMSSLLSHPPMVCKLECSAALRTAKCRDHLHHYQMPRSLIGIVIRISKQHAAEVVQLHNRLPLYLRPDMDGYLFASFNKA